MKVLPPTLLIAHFLGSPAELLSLLICVSIMLPCPACVLPETKAVKLKAGACVPTTQNKTREKSKCNQTPSPLIKTFIQTDWLSDLPPIFKIGKIDTDIHVLGNFKHSSKRWLA